MKSEVLIEKIYARPYLRVALHILFWLSLLGLQWYINSISFNPFRAFPESVRFQQLVSGILSFIIFYYPFVYVVLPKFFFRKKILVGILLSILLILLFGFLETLREQLILRSCEPCMSVFKDVNPDYYRYLHFGLLQRLSGKLATMGLLIGLLFSIAIPLAIKMGISAFRQQLRTIRLAKENIQLEFDFLKSQVNPHFLFNTLNNIYGLILNDDKEKSAATVARLSQFLRYTLYESNDKEVPVEKEMQLLKDYIAMESIRLNHTKVDVKIISDGSVDTIPPLLMIPVVENAFKYSKDEGGAAIRIDFNIRNKKISFTIDNPIDAARQQTTGGIGLKNFQKRLELHYPERFSYKVESTGKTYTAIINIDAHE